MSAADYASESHDIGSVWDAAVAYSLTHSQTDRDALSALVSAWKQQHPQTEMEEE